MDEDAGTGVLAAWLPLQADEPYASKPQSDWVEQWARWHLAQNDCSSSAFFDLDGTSCATQQDDDASPVFFLDSGEYPTSRAGCRLPADKAVLVPLIYFVADGRDALFETPSAADLEAEAARVLSTMRDLHLVVDGRPTNALERWTVQTKQISVEFPPEPNYYTCRDYSEIEGQLDAFVTGVFALLPPPPTAAHRALTYGGTYSYMGWDEVREVTAFLQFE